VITMSPSLLPFSAMASHHGLQLPTSHAAPPLDMRDGAWGFFKKERAGFN
jgi:hypothetical protein